MPAINVAMKGGIESDKEFWKIGELAQQTGLSVRTLHHYHQIGLLVPAHRTEAGHRLYSVADIARLQQILSLRQLGLSLDEVGNCLRGERFSPGEVIHMHLEQLQHQISLLQQICQRLERIGEQVNLHQEITADEFIKLIGEMIMTEKYAFTEEQMEKIRRQGELLGPEKIRQAEQEWPELIAKVQDAMAKGVPPTSPEVRQLARRWRELVDMFTGGDQGIAATLQRRYQDEPGYAAQYGIDLKIFSYIAQASNQD